MFVVVLFDLAEGTTLVRLIYIIYVVIYKGDDEATYGRRMFSPFAAILAVCGRLIDNKRSK